MADGARGDIISLYPPLTFSADDIAEASDRLHAAFAEVEQELRA
jgi:4-aminobutyrate aminotransferase-like enzyme